MASSSSSSNYDAFGRRDSAFSAVSNTSGSPEPGTQMYQPRPQRTASDTTIKRPLRLSNAYKRRVSSASVNSRSSINTTFKPGHLIDTPSTDKYTNFEDYGYPSDVNRVDYDTQVPELVETACSCCSIPEPSHAHDDEYPEKCWEHQMCLTRGGWKKHIERFQHTSCPLPDCSRSGSEFSTQDKFVNHWVKRHEEKCWYWGKKKTVFGSEKAVWVKWTGS